MRRVLQLAAAIGLAAQGPGAAQGQSPAEAPSVHAVTGAITGCYSALPDQLDYGMAVGSVNIGSPRFEGRYNYEARASASACVGWKFAGGDEIAWEVTPLVGTLFGRAHGAVPGFEAAVSCKAFDF